MTEVLPKLLDVHISVLNLFSERQLPAKIIVSSSDTSSNVYLVVLVDVEGCLSAGGLFYTVAVAVIDERSAAGNRYRPVFYIPANGLCAAGSHITISIVSIISRADCRGGMRFRTVGINFLRC